MSTGSDKKYIDNYDGTEVYSPSLPDGWLEVESDGQHYLKHPNMPMYRDPVTPGLGDGALGIFNPFNLNIGGDSNATEGKHFTEDTYYMGVGTPVENWFNFASAKVSEFKAKIDALKALWDGRPWPTAVPAGALAYTVGDPATTYDGSGSTGGGPSGIVSYLWEVEDGVFRNGTVATDVSIDIEWLAAGTKEVKLTVTDEYGRQDSVALSVVVTV